MAAETIILRPIDICGSVSANMPTHYPSDTDILKLYTLINEEYPDDDASYIQLSQIYCAAFAIPDRFIGKTPTNIKVYYRCRGTSSDAVCEINISTGYINPGDGTELNKVDSANYIEIGSNIAVPQQYTTLYINMPEETISSSLIFNETKTYIFIWPGFKSATNTSKNATVNTTQIYLEVTYSDDDPETTLDNIYLKENGTWISVPCTIYQKQNGSWITADSSIFENGDRFTIQQLT